MRALDRLSRDIRPMTVRREGAPHDSLLRGRSGPGSAPPPSCAPFWSGRTGTALEPYLPRDGLEVLRAGWSGFPSLERAERGLLARLRTMTAEDWARIPDSGAGEGLPPRLERAGRQCRSLEEFSALAKPKHWTQARMRRLLVWAWLGLTREDRPARPPISGCWASTAGGRPS